MDRKGREEPGGGRRGGGASNQGGRRGKKVQINHPSGIITSPKPLPPDPATPADEGRWLQSSLIIYMSVFSLVSTKKKTFYICMQPVAWQRRFQRSDLLKLF